MGSLASRPKAPAVQTVYTPVYVPSPAPATQTQIQSSSSSQIPSDTGGNGDAQAPAASEGEQASARRAQNLLERNRGAFGTILTGFKGVLNQSTQPQRKTLLGE